MILSPTGIKEGPSVPTQVYRSCLARVRRVGSDCLRRFNGMFAFAIWNQRANCLFLARDRIGEKPLYYYQDSDRLIFASEIKAILADPVVPRRLNPRAWPIFFVLVTPSPRRQSTSGSYKLLPGHYLIARDAQVQTSRYWEVGDEPQLPLGSILTEAEYAERILLLLDDSVRRRNGR